MIARRNVKTTRIAHGDSRSEGREPSHDGEYLTLYYVPGNDQWLLEDNARVTATDDAPRPDGCDDDDQWEDVLVEVAEDMRRDRGDLAVSCGGASSTLMENMGWIQTDAEYPEETHHIHHA